MTQLFRAGYSSDANYFKWIVPKPEAEQNYVTTNRITVSTAYSARWLCHVRRPFNGHREPKRPKDLRHLR
jgi:hypothetical protein